MIKSNIEISEQEYLIKLNKSEFDLSLIKNLLKRIDYEQSQKNKSSIMEIEDLKTSELYYENINRFDCLSDK